MVAGLQSYVTLPLHGEALYNALQTPPPAGTIQVWRLGGAGVAVQTEGSLLYIDPFLAKAGGPGWVRNAPPPLERLPPPTAILLTHEHDDHADPVALAMLAKDGQCMVVAPAPAAGIARQSGFSDDHIHIVRAGDVAQADPFTVSAWAVDDPDAQEPLAYTVEIVLNGSRWRFFHGGDAVWSARFVEIGTHTPVDCCALSIAGMYQGKNWYLSPNGGVQAAAALGATTLIPVHWDLWTTNSLPASTWDAPDLRETAARAGITVRVLASGETFTAIPASHSTACRLVVRN